MEADEDQENSVFKLITSLCEKFYTSPDDIKFARSRCYDILLGKRSPKCKKEFTDLEGTSDPYCNLLSWQFKLIHQYNMRNHAEELQNAVDTVKECYESDMDFFNRILKFLMDLRNIPKKNTNILALSSLPPIEEYENFNKLFQLPDSFRELSTNLETIPSSRTLLPEESKSLIIKDFKYGDMFKDEGYESPSKTPENIWELASKLKYSKRKTWESYGYPEPEKEPPFLSELGPLSSLWVENLESLYMYKLFKDGAVFNSRLIPRKNFIKDLKCLLVGMASESFTFDENGAFYLVPGISIEAITPDSLQRYSKDLIFTGTCCKALNKLSTPNLETGKYRYQGYVFTEFCESVNRYLKFYQTAIFSIPNDINLVHFHDKTYELSLQINTLASVCKVGPYTVSEEIENSVALLNYLYHKVLNLTDQKVIYVLYSILYPCCQVYFSRFLKQWMLEGTLNDPYDEFFIKTNSKYIVTRGRTYWTRSFIFVEDIVPDFLIDLKSDILICGKAMSLLKFCPHLSKFRLYLMGSKPPIISCCVTLDQLAALRHNTTRYYLDVYEECGPRFSMREVLVKFQQLDPLVLALIAKKRAATLKRIELEREKVIMTKNEKKLEEINNLKEQYDIVLSQKQYRIAKEIEEEMNYFKENLDIELKRQKLLKEETTKMIDYYAKLFEIADSRKAKIENHIKTIKNTHMEQKIPKEDSPKKDIESIKEELKEKDNQTDITNSSTESYYSIPDETKKLENIKESINGAKDEIIDSSWDVINANVELRDDNANTGKFSANIQQAIDNFAVARKNKQRVLTEELGMDYCHKHSTLPTDVSNLSQAQKNKLKVLSSEFGMPVKPDVIRSRILTTAVINKNKIMGLSDCFDYKLDNENFLNRNVKNVESRDGKSSIIKKSKSLVLDLEKAAAKLAKPDLDRPIPMSVDSTPLSELPLSPLTTPSGSMFLSCDTYRAENSAPTTAETCRTEQDFDYRQHEETIVPIYANRSSDKFKKTVFSKRVSEREVNGLSTNSLKLFLNECVQIPLVTQTKLVNNELLRYFVEDLEYLNHLSSIRDYFFLQDGEFGRHITDNLFSRLYEATFPAQLINCRILQDLVFGALDMSNKNHRFAGNLSFKINSVPKCFDLGNPDVLDCLSLTYKVNWPLNILLPTDAIGKYDEVFKFLLKLNRVTWVLKKIFLELKVLARETGKKEIYLMASPQYRKLHQCRHIMTQFVQTLQSYVVGEVLQSSWAEFEKKLAAVTSLDEIYEAHTMYIKNILFMCLLTQKMAVLKNIIHKTFMVILKFYDYLRSRSWVCEEGQYIHPNFNKLESIFKNFQEFELYLFKVIRKVAKSGYQPHLLQLLEMLDINRYFTESLKNSSSMNAIH